MMIDHRTMTGEEMLFLTKLAAHRGKDPLKLGQIERRMLPHPGAQAQMNLYEWGYIKPGRMASGKPVANSWQITPEGAQVIVDHIHDVIADTNGRAAKTEIAPERARLILLTDQLTAYAQSEQIHEREPDEPDAGPDDDLDDAAGEPSPTALRPAKPPKGSAGTRPAAKKRSRSGHKTTPPPSPAPTAERPNRMPPVPSPDTADTVRPQRRAPRRSGQGDAA